jgi:hypothetical protein
VSPLQRRLTKLEQYRQSDDVEWELDRLLEKAGTSRAAVMAEFGSLWAYRDWLEAQGPGPGLPAKPRPCMPAGAASGTAA